MWTRVVTPITSDKPRGEHRGYGQYPDHVHRKHVSDVAGFSWGSANAGNDGLAMLTDRERDVLEVMAQELSNSQIGERLFLSHNGVGKHVANIFIQLGYSTDDNRRVRAVLAWFRREDIHWTPSKPPEPR